MRKPGVSSMSVKGRRCSDARLLISANSRNTTAPAITTRNSRVARGLAMIRFASAIAPATITSTLFSVRMLSGVRRTRSDTSAIGAKIVKTITCQRSERFQPSPMNCRASIHAGMLIRYVIADSTKSVSRREKPSSDGR